MNKEQLEQRLEHLGAEAVKSDGDFEPFLEVIESLLKEELKKDPQNSDLWIRRAMLEYTPPWEDFDVIISYLNKIFEYDPYYPEAVLVAAYMQDLFRGGVTDETFDQLLHVKSDDSEIMGMIEIAKAWYYRDRDERLYEQCLKRSIEYAPDFLAHYVELGKLYFAQGNRQLGKKLIKKGLDNLKGIYEETYFSNDFTDINEFFNEFFKKNYRTEINYRRDERWLTEEDPSDTITFI